MTVAEKRAWYVLAVCVLSLIAIAVIYRLTGSGTRASAGFAVMGLTGLMPLIGLKRKRAGEVVEDERDNAIRQRAARIAFGVVWLFAFLSFTALLLTRGDHGIVSVSAIGAALWTAFVLVYAVHSIATIVMYRENRGE